VAFQLAYLTLARVLSWLALLACVVSEVGLSL
jgi:hypothetical protein